ncbi:MAG: hypothetical protein A2136_01945 [Chloroflexi bacterium RBG_16_54_11]|nr:MAG: hypothetical protein A2136_01945 [Chloroflexi bacterium RBG_16_54_11]
MAKVEQYQDKLHSVEDWDEYLLKESGLPGPRGNIELAQAVAREGNREVFMRYRAYTADIAPINSPYEFLAFCGTLGLGRLLAEGDTDQLEALRTQASDPRWRVREGVAMALQLLGDEDMGILVDAMQSWSLGNFLEQRAAAAALCEPRLLHAEQYARRTLDILDTITSSLEGSEERHGAAFIALRKGLGYCWSVAVAALPQEGKPLMEKWLANMDRDIQWIMRENLKKNRLVRMDPAWVEQWRK